MAAVYSARFRRCTATRPGLGLAAAAASSAPSIADVIAVYVAASGRGRPGGGISCVRSLVATFSQISALLPTWSTSSASSVSPAVLSFVLWQVTQYLSSIARGDSTEGDPLACRADLSAVAPAGAKVEAR